MWCVRYRSHRDIEATEIYRSHRDISKRQRDTEETERYRSDRDIEVIEFYIFPWCRDARVPLHCIPVRAISMLLPLHTNAAVLSAVLCIYRLAAGLSCHRESFVIPPYRKRRKWRMIFSRRNFIWRRERKKEDENLGMGVATVVPGSELEHYQMLSCPSSALRSLLLTTCTVCYFRRNNAKDNDHATHFKVSEVD